MNIKDKYTVHEIPKHETRQWVLKKHYLHRIPPISHAFGLFDSRNVLCGICTFGCPASASLCVGLCGDEYKDIVLELNRLCLEDDTDKNARSYFVMSCLKKLSTPRIIVSYADTSVGHVGYIYQATNFIYTGLSAERTDCKLKDTEDGKHSRHLFDKYGGINKIKEKFPDMVEWRERPQKHRYVMFLGNKRQRRQMKSKLNYPIKPYPKGDNKRYDTSYQPDKQGILF